MIIPVSPAHIDTLCDVLMAAFADDRFYTYAFGGPDYSRRLRAHFAHGLEDGIAAGMAFTHAQLDSVAIWSHSDLPSAPQREKPAAYQRVVAVLENAAPPAPALYLHILATAPHARGNGAGSALTRHMFDWADARGWPVYLETQTRANLAFYGRLGFRETGLLYDDDGLTIWGMLRPSNQV
jgi:GNAT superfamily N-acetyltransferase